MKQINAPFTDAQIAKINNFQTAGIVHEFTCPNDGAGLIAETRGMVCPTAGCDYRQTWVHEPMADGSALEGMEAMMKAFKGDK